LNFKISHADCIVWTVIDVAMIHSSVVALVLSLMSNPRNSCLPHCVLDRFGEIFYETAKNRGLKNILGEYPNKKYISPLPLIPILKSGVARSLAIHSILNNTIDLSPEQTRYTSIQHIT